MKRILTLAAIVAVTFTSYSQSLGYQDLGLLFSQDDNTGTARFTSMSGAFGALGGDISAITINPAGIAVYKNSAFSASFNSRETNLAATYYGNTSTSQQEYFNLSHAGAVLVFDSANSSEWSKFAVGFNYRVKKDFSDHFFARGNSGFASFNEFPLDNNTTPIDYNVSEEQAFNNTFNGELSEFNFGFSSVHQNKLYVGASLSTYDINFNQRSTLREANNDGNGNTLDARFYQENTTTGTGFSLNAGFIYKLHPNFRFGLSYQTPSWFMEIVEQTNILDNDGFLGDTEISVSNDNTTYANTSGGFFPSQNFIYKLKTPSKLTASAAFIFGKMGLISVDYATKNYQNLKLSDADFTAENQFFQDDLRNAYTLNLGTEWRFDRFSLRGGYQFEQSPDKNALDSDNLEGYSIGGGYNFGSFKVDFSYTDNNRTSQYNFYPQYNQVNPADLAINNKVFTTTITLNL